MMKLIDIFAFKMFPLILFLLLICLPQHRTAVIFVFIGYIVSLLLYGRDYDGNEVIFGIKKSDIEKWMGK